MTDLPVAFSPPNSFATCLLRAGCSHERSGGVAAASQAAPPWPPARSPSGGSPPPTHLTRGAGSCLTGDSNRRLEARDLGLPEVQCDHTKRQLVEDGSSTISQRDFSRGSNDFSWVPDGEAPKP
ncbi:hypothetical protein PVAP13_2KG192991 [Panicum virgatum]|uniref:Uncharacterized protein n=1 Tax=Panicum virgatum TaxID=38727 RepID=A0A8T0W533_PANVG|nr:hypothetical protein PVAP13_2KG192991 [Panicum virgatum]KAG2642600.1 hypothetical protein PVAP13_2KG192991 [Panicum virgatum]KAG2642602.1 hypothetical protein PVAP13_2KG192991 [Panicum virgatum]